jgi:hypothetical protein
MSFDLESAAALNAASRGILARLVMDEEEFRNAHVDLRYALVDLALRLSIRFNYLSHARERRKRFPRKGR